ncbi:MAG: hypothetical protein ACK4PR_00460, partial [Gammaproteobacteria bacterium]
NKAIDIIDAELIRLFKELQIVIPEEKVRDLTFKNWNGGAPQNSTADKEELIESQKENTNSGASLISLKDLGGGNIQEKNAPNNDVIIKKKAKISAFLAFKTQYKIKLNAIDESIACLSIDKNPGHETFEKVIKDVKQDLNDSLNYIKKNESIINKRCADGLTQLFEKALHLLSFGLLANVASRVGLLKSEHKLHDGLEKLSNKNLENKTLAMMRRQIRMSA